MTREEFAAQFQDALERRAANPPPPEEEEETVVDLDAERLSRVEQQRRADGDCPRPGCLQRAGHRGSCKIPPEGAASLPATQHTLACRPCARVVYVSGSVTLPASPRCASCQNELEVIGRARQARAPEPSSSRRQSRTPTPTPTGPDPLVLALVQLGFTKAEIAHAIREVPPGRAVGERLRDALRVIGRHG